MVRMSSARRSGRDERGVIAILVVAVSMVMFGFAAIVVDLSLARDVQRQSQNASDASALAAGNALYLAGTTPDITGATNAAKSYAAANYGVPADAWNSCVDPGHRVVPPGGSQCISYSPNLTKPTTVRVKVPLREVGTPFAALLGVNHVTVGAQAHASVDPGGAAECGLCVIGTGTLHDLQNGGVTVQGAGIHLNGSVRVGPNGWVATDGNSITVESTASGAPTNYSPNPLTGQPQMPDPLANLTLPPSMTGLVNKTNPCGTGSTHGPGIYGARDLRNGTCYLQPGLYVIAGGGGTTWDLAGNQSTKLVGAGVSLYFTCGTTSAPRACAPGESGANLDASGNGFISIQAPTSGPLQGVAIAYDRRNTSMLRLTGNGSDNLTGTIYLSSGRLQMNGNGCSSIYNALIVVKDLEMNGSPSCLRSAYTLSTNVQIPPAGLHLSH